MREVAWIDIGGDAAVCLLRELWETVKFKQLPEKNLTICAILIFFLLVNSENLIFFY